MGAFELHGQVIGTIRVVPMHSGLTLTEMLLAQGNTSVPVSQGERWEVGRLVLDPEFRSDPDTLRQCLFLALSYLTEHSQANDLYASCSHVLGRLYRRFGFTAFASDVLLAGTEKKYTLIHGVASEVLRALGAKRGPHGAVH